MLGHHQNADLNFKEGTLDLKPGIKCSSCDPGILVLVLILQAAPKPKIIRAWPQFLPPAGEVQPHFSVVLPSG